RSRRRRPATRRSGPHHSTTTTAGWSRRGWRRRPAREPARMSSVPSVEPERAASPADVRGIGAEQAARPPRRLDLGRAVGRAVPPVVIGLAGLVAWELVVRLNQIPYYILPGPLLVGKTLVRDWGTLYPSLLVTLAITGAALLVATVAGVLISILFTQSKLV